MKNSVVIPVRLETIDQLLIGTSLFDGKRRLTQDAEEHILEEAREAPGNAEICLEFYLQADALQSASEIETAVHHHFAYSSKKAERRLKQSIDLGWRSLFIAFVFLAILISLIFVLVTVSPTGGVSTVVKEILIIFGWVALWRPADLLLYEWRPIKRELRLFRRLANCRVSIASAG